MQSKSGLYFLAREFTKQQDMKAAVNNSGNKVLHVALHPGFMKTELQRHMPSAVRAIMGMMLKDAKHGAYTELYAGLAAGVESGAFYWPWGRRGVVPAHVEASTQPPANGGKSVSERFYEWCERETKLFMWEQ
jgi:retinol dehydrogenase 12